MSIGETAANGVNHTPSGTDSGEERISEVLANAKSSDTREGFIILIAAARRAEAFLNLFDLAPPEHAFELAKFKAFGSQIAGELHAAIAKVEGETP